MKGGEVKKRREKEKRAKQERKKKYKRKCEMGENLGNGGLDGIYFYIFNPIY